MAEAIQQQVRERPILFSGPMVRAILAGRKTQTRRIVRTDARRKDGAKLLPELLQQIGVGAACPYGAPGDRLWVKESIRRVGSPVGPDRWCDSEYAADGTPTIADAWPWRNKALPSIHCPRGLSRITLEVTDVRVQHLHDISEGDIEEEGVRVNEVASLTGVPWSSIPDLHTAFRSLWEHLHGLGSWEANPWVWAVSFRRVDAR